MHHQTKKQTLKDMRHITKYCCVDDEDKRLFLTPDASVIAEKLGITTRELAHKILTFPKKLAESLKISEDDVFDVIFGRFNKDLSDMIEFSVFGKEEALYKEKAVYTEKCNALTNWRYVKNYLDVYICEEQYAELIGSDVARFILTNQYPHIFKHPDFVKSVQRFNNDKIFSLTPQTRLRDIDSILMKGEGIEYLDYTIQDLIDVITNPHNYDKTKEESLFSIYAQSACGKDYISIYLNLEKDISLTIPIEALQNNDWSVIEDAMVYNIPCYPNKKCWYNGSQKNAPYFNHPLILRLKELFMR